MLIGSQYSPFKPEQQPTLVTNVIFHSRSHPTSALAPVLLPTLATLNNLSFYPIILCAEIYDNLKYFVTNCTPSYDQLVAVEAIRVMGNLSRDLF